MIVSVVRPRKSNFTDRKSTRLNSSHLGSSYAVFCSKKKKLRGWSKETIRGVCQPFIFLAQLTSLALLGGIAIDRASIVMFAAIVPALLVRSWVGWLI